MGTVISNAVRNLLCLSGEEADFSPDKTGFEMTSLDAAAYPASVSARSLLNRTAYLGNTPFVISNAVRNLLLPSMMHGGVYFDGAKQISHPVRPGSK
jgi:hypothetical protein